jgi:hypothetical protein
MFEPEAPDSAGMFEPEAPVEAPSELEPALPAAPG